MSRLHHPQPRFDASDSLLDGPDIPLDLHGESVALARDLVVRFVHTNARARRGAVLHIITGKGKRSVNGAKLRPMVRDLLRNVCRAYVADFALDVDEGGYRVRLK